jgi:hypothetical protein
MRKYDNRLILGLLLIAAGVFYLLQTLGLFTLSQLVWGVAAAVGAVVFIVLAVRGQWWAWIPGLTLLGVAGLVGLEYAAPGAAKQRGGSLFLGAIGISFWLIYLLKRAHWWAIIPGGVLLTLAVVAGLDQLGGLLSGGVFFFGLGLTFLLVAIAPNPHGHMRWAFIPAIILVILGALLSAGQANATRLIGPIALIAVGGWFLFRTFRPRPDQPKVDVPKE